MPGIVCILVHVDVYKSRRCASCYLPSRLRPYSSGECNSNCSSPPFLFLEIQWRTSVKGELGVLYSEDRPMRVRGLDSGIRMSRAPSTTLSLQHGGEMESMRKNHRRSQALPVHCPQCSGR